MRSIRVIADKIVGQNSKEDPTKLFADAGRGAMAAPLFPMVRGFRTDNGVFNGVNIGQKAEYLTTTSFCLAQFIWDAPNGYQYHLAYESTGSAMAGVVKYWRTPVPTTSGMAYTGTVTNLSGLPTNIVPSFVDAGNGYLYVACGQAGVYKVAPDGSAALAATAVSTLPASSNMVIWRNRTWIAANDETIIRWSPINDFERLIPTQSEISADTYGIDRRVTLVSQGVEGFVTGMFGCDAYLAVWTNKDMCIIVGNGESGQTSFLRCGRGYGMSGLKSFAYKDNILYWKSDYNGGTILGAVVGAIPAGGKVLTSIGARQFTLHIFDAAETIASEFIDTPAMDCKVIGIGICDSRGDWEDTFSSGDKNKIYANSNLDTSSEPGYIKACSASGALTPALGYAGIDSTWTVVQPLSNAIDGNPSTYWQASNSQWNPTPRVRVYIEDAARQILYDYILPFTVYATPQSFTISGPFENVGTVYIQFASMGAKNITPTFSYSGARITSITFSAAYQDNHVLIYEFSATGTQSTTTHITSQVFKVEGLTSNNNALDSSSRALGRFYVSYIGTSSDGTGLGTATGLNSESFSVAQIRASSDPFVYNAADSTLAWQNVTEAQLKTGYQLNSNSQFTASNGVLYVQFRIALQVVNGVSPKIDSAGFYFWMGNNQKSINPMGYKGKNLLCCVRNTDISTLPDKTIVLNDYGGRSTILGQQITSFLNYKDKIYSAQGMRIAEYWGGIENRQTANDTRAPIERRIRYPRISIPGKKVYPRKCDIKIDKYDMPATSVGSSVFLCNGLGARASGGNVSKNICYEAYDGSHLTLVRTGTSNTNLYLVRSNAITGEKRAILIESNPTYSYGSGSLAINDTKTKLYIVSPTPSLATSGRYIKYWVYDIASETLSSSSLVATSEDTNNVFYNASIVLLDGMHIVYNTAYNNSCKFYHTYSSNYEDNSPTWSTPSLIEDYTASGADGSLFITKDNTLGLVYCGTSGGGVAYFIEHTEDGWMGADALRTVSSASFIAAVSHNGVDHCFIYDDPTIYIWTRSAETWAQATTITGGASPGYMISAAPYGDDEIAVIWVNNSYVNYSTGFEDTFAAKTETTTSSTYVASLSKNNGDRLYMITQPGWSGTYPYYQVLFPLHTSPVGALKCVATTDKGAYDVFERETAISSPVSLPHSGRFPNIGDAEYLDIEIIGYGDTKISASDFEIDFTED